MRLVVRELSNPKKVAAGGVSTRIVQIIDTVWDWKEKIANGETLPEPIRIRDSSRRSPLPKEGLPVFEEYNFYFVASEFLRCLFCHILQKTTVSMGFQTQKQGADNKKLRSSSWPKQP